MRNLKRYSRAAVIAIVSIVLAMLTFGCSNMKQRVQSQKHPTENLEAYNLYVMGNHAKKIWAWQRALDYYQQAVEKDSDFAAAHAEIAFLHAQYAMGPGDNEEASAEATKALEMALAIDSSLPAAYMAQGMLHMRNDWDWDSAEANYKKAIEIDPGYLFAYLQIDDVLILLNKEQEALALTLQAYEQDPLSLDVLYQTMAMLKFMGFNDEAMQVYRKFEMLYPNNGSVHLICALYDAYNGGRETAEYSLTRYMQASGTEYTKASVAGFVAALMGDKTEAEKLLTGTPSDTQVLYVNLGIRDYDAILDQLEAQAEEHNPDIFRTLLTCKRYRKEINALPRWKTLMKTVGLPE